MTVEPTYRIDHSKRHTTGDTAWEISGGVDFLISEGILVLDPTLQALADAHNRYRGAALAGNAVDSQSQWETREALLDALSDGDKE